MKKMNEKKQVTKPATKENKSQAQVPKEYAPKADQKNAFANEKKRK